MPIRSMTGFGRASFDLAGLPYVVEVRSVNHRFLDSKLRLPREFAATEPEIRRVVAGRVHRGRVDLAVSALAGDVAITHSVSVNEPLADAVVAAHQRLAARFSLRNDLTVVELARWPGVLLPAAGAGDEPVATEPLLRAVSEALDALEGMRVAEGAALEIELRGLAGEMERLHARLAARAPEQARSFELRLIQRMREALGELDVGVDEAMLLQEVAAFAERSDVAEELSRLLSHLAQLRDALDLATDVSVGRRLDFLCQEMGREANTIASKINDLELSALTIDLKSLLERLREQVQNVE